MNDFILHMSLRSPFARRVRLLLENLNVSYEPKTVDVFNPPAAFFQVNPLARVPALEIVKTGEIIIDSNQIFLYLRERYPTASVFNLRGLSLEKALKYSGLAVGMMELVVARYLELLKSPTQQAHETIKEAEDNVGRTLKFFEAEVTSPFFSKKADDQVGFWEIDLGAILGYIKLRMGENWLEKHPNLVKYEKLLSEKPEFIKTAPPK